MCQTGKNCRRTALYVRFLSLQPQSILVPLRMDPPSQFRVSSIMSGNLTILENEGGEEEVRIALIIGHEYWLRSYPM